VGSNAVTTWEFPHQIGSMGLTQSGACVMATGSDIILFDPSTSTRTRLASPLQGLTDVRFNDGKCDPQGRFWVGSMHKKYAADVGQIFRSDGAGCVVMDEEFGVPNGPAWSPDGSRFVFSCSTSDTTYFYDFDADTGSITNQRVGYPPKTAPGFPDGAAMDADGCLWSARWDGGCVARITPDGRVDRLVGLPCSRVTSCAFGGPRLETLYVTTARSGLTEAELADQPLAGSVFAIDPGVAGVPVAAFRD
ncbi:MAG: SMP-30/gluconolactonase/LRE family protein, partial [Pseudomonadota bacterium]